TALVPRGPIANVRLPRADPARLRSGARAADRPASEGRGTGRLSRGRPNELGAVNSGCGLGEHRTAMGSRRLRTLRCPRTRTPVLFARAGCGAKNDCSDRSAQAAGELDKGKTMDLGFTGSRAVVSGGSKGMGLAIAETLAAEGASVAVMARGRAALDAAVE